MSPLEMLFGQIANQVQNHASPNSPGPEYDSNSILGTIGKMFTQHSQQSGQQFRGYDNNYDYANDNNYGGGVASSDQDPYGDPGATGQQGNNSAFGNIQSSDADPYGDPGLK